MNNEPTFSRETRDDSDPTALTTQQLSIAITGLKELFITRLEAMDKAIILLQDVSNRSPSINEVYLKHEEKFENIKSRLSELTAKFKEMESNIKETTAVALLAAKEAAIEQNRSNNLAINKSESAFTKQIDQIGTTIQALEKGFDDKIDDIKQRINNTEGRSRGISDSWGWLVGAIGLIAGIIGIIGTVIAISMMGSGNGSG